MKALFPLLASALALGSTACRSSEPSSEGAAVECICGDPIADVKGCPHAACATGKTNPENPDCVCGTLSIR